MTHFIRTTCGTQHAEAEEPPAACAICQDERQCRLTGQRHDPCLLDTFIAAVRFLEGGPKKPWWAYTAQRKREMAARSTGSQ